MSTAINHLISKVKSSKYSFCKFISPNDSGETGSHQAGLYIPKNSIKLLFDEPGVKGQNKEKNAKITWQDGHVSEARFIYYGQGSRNEYRITRLGRNLNVGEFLILVKESESDYLAYILKGKKDIDTFLKTFDLSVEDTNSLIKKSSENAFHKEESSFKPKARLILQLGEQLIRNEQIAVLEIIKNAYDADASMVKLSFNQLNSSEASIIFEDDGVGMNAEIVKNVWLQPGSDFKKKLVNEKVVSEKYKRLPLGEKGIGRFGVHKLGHEIELITKQKDSREVFLRINWRDFEEDSLLENIPVVLIEREPQYFDIGESGTKIIIRDLKNKWTRGNVRDLYRSVNSLNSPFKTKESFSVLFKLDQQDWLSGLLTFDSIRKSALFYAEAEIENNLITRLHYEFTPWDSMTKIKGRSIENFNIKMTHKVFDETIKKKIQKDINLSEHGKIGPVKLRLLIFDQDSRVLSLGVQDKAGLKEYLKLNGGIRVYRDGIRVYDYGEPGNDWLSLDSERVNQPAVKLSNNIVIGAVELERLESGGLIEKTNREGFVEDPVYEDFNNAIRFAITQISAERNIDKEKLRNLYGVANESEPVMSNLSLLHSKIASYIPKGEFQNELLQSIREIEREYKEISDIYIRSASAGLSLSIVIHEIEKIISELTKVVEEDKSSFRITTLTKHLARLIDGYSGVIRYKSKKKIDLRNIIEQALFNIEFRLKAHDVSVQKMFIETKSNVYVKCSDSLILGNIINIIDNSIWWLGYGNVKNKELFIDISDRHEGYTSIIIADNGPGFNISPEAATKPFITKKVGGIGIGLHVAHEIMNSHGGELLFGKNNFEVPKEFQKGAIVSLAFKKEN